MFFTELNNLQCKTYLIADIDAKVAAIIDPVDSNIDRYIGVLAYHNLKLEFVADTHTHADHRSACSAVRKLTGCQVMMHEFSPQPSVDNYFKDGAELMVGSIKVKVLHTPGHTPDSVSFYVNEDRVLTGDVMLIQGTGRADFAGGDAGHQYDAITTQLFTLPKETLVFPAHDYRGNTESTIAIEKATNPRIAGKTRDEYIEIMANLNLPLPERIQEVLQINQSELDDDRIKFPLFAELNNVLQMDAELVKNRMDTGTENTVVIDVRQEHELKGELGHIKNARNVPVADIPNSLGMLELIKDKEIILICRSGIRSTTAAAILKGLGFSDVKNMKGGMLNWVNLGYPIERD
ncbi:MAG: sulfurtransferase [Cycloclasticus sp. symbiont of Poecilosclerida sp. N]|nr:MAG: sulfurtransferase [Cycloclasticus sp. symbiont of Poecilosclerida sp. N]